MPFPKEQLRTTDLSRTRSQMHYDELDRREIYNVIAKEKTAQGAQNAGHRIFP